MDTDLFDHFQKDKNAEHKLAKLTLTERKLVSMKFLLAMLSDIESVRVQRFEDQVLKDGRRLSILLFDLELGQFVFGIPRYTDSALVLIDFELVEDGLLREGWTARPLQ